MLYVDLFLYHEMKKRMETDACLQYFFSDNIPDIEPIPKNDRGIVRVLSNKINKNVLLDWINKEKFCEMNDPNMLVIYVENLVKDMLQNPTCDEYVQLTGFGNNLRILCNDNNTSRVTLYMPYDSDIIYESIRDAFNGYSLDKLSVFVGQKEKKAKEFIADSYVLEDARDIDKYLSVKYAGLTEVIIPAYEFNLIEDRSNIEKLIEQVTITRLKLDHEEKWYRDNFNLSINTIATPI